MQRILLWWALAMFAMVNFAHAKTELTLYCGQDHPAIKTCAAVAQQWADENDVELSIRSIPGEVGQALEFYNQLFSASGRSIDVLAIDVIWPSMLKDHLLDLLDYVPQDIVNDHFPAIVSAYVVQGKLLALPQFIDAGMLFYRKDLLDKYNEKVPETWKQLERISLKIQKAEREAGNEMWGYVFQGKEGEGLTCNALEWLDSYDSGQLMGVDGIPMVNNSKSVRALRMAKNWIGRISPPNVLNMNEEASRGVFQFGQAVFMRNWPYVWSLANGETSEIAGRVGVAPLPKGQDGKHTGTLGGWGMAVSKYTRNPKLAVDLAKHLTSMRVQKERLEKHSLNPTILQLYADKETLKANPIALPLFEIFSYSVVRPTNLFGAHYNEVSQAFSKVVHKILRDEGGIDGLLGVLEHELRMIMSDVKNSR